MKKSWVLAFLLGTTLASSLAIAAPLAKKTQVCSVTINSSDEIEVFKKNLNPATHDFIELTTLQEKDSDETEANANWFPLACKKKVQCDILLISGHFGGSFFGSSGLNLPVEELEKKSCDTSCDGVLQAPKEVFLFGCNTLAGKNADRRTPEEYRRVLIADGFSTEEAEQVVSFRYSPLGNSFGERMRRIFRGAPRIYGFDSIAPSGKNVRGLLDNYFKKVPKQYYTPAHLNKISSDRNDILAQALKVTALTQVAGASELKREQIPACFLNNENVGFYKKLHWVKSALNSDQSFQSLPAINEWLISLTDQNYQWRDKEFEVLEQVMANTTLRDRLAAIIKTKDTSMLGMQLKILSFMKFFGWVYAKDYSTKLQNLLLGDINQDYTIEHKDQVCSYAENLGIKIDMTSDMIPAARWQDPEFLDVLACTSMYRPDVFRKAMTQYLELPQNSPVGASSLNLMLSYKVPTADQADIFKTLVGTGTSPISEKAKGYLCSYRVEGKMTLALPEIPPALLNDKNYLDSAPCFIKFNQRIFEQLFTEYTQAIRNKNKDRQTLMFDVLRDYSSKSSDISNNTAQLMLNAADSSDAKISQDMEWLMIYYFENTSSKFSPSIVQQIAKKALKKFDQLQYQESYETNLVQIMMNQNKEYGCSVLKEKALQEIPKNIAVAAQTLNFAVDHCRESFNDDTLATFLSTLAKKKSTVLRAGNLKNLTTAISLNSNYNGPNEYIRIRDWKELLALTSLLAESFEKGGEVLEPEDMLKVTDMTVVRPQIIEQALKGNASAFGLIKTFSIQDARLKEALVAQIKKSTLKHADDSGKLSVLMTLDSSAGTKLLMELSLKDSKSAQEISWISVDHKTFWQHLKATLGRADLNDNAKAEYLKAVTKFYIDGAVKASIQEVDKLLKTQQPRAVQQLLKALKEQLTERAADEEII
ncbi:hypothetical protein AZI86_11375 [Bdellovibrio bacteriovorus]|uniref:Caspase family p20 domain-containing protein n=1 Tax=Bdellovibrio bacteriovorus TaxID=959 RepID=A0A150WLI8_BDEBC|nr:hypothetical protein [Bdellovibrio bacteriovorus]KYG64798.1 hypothetical protein AZI86_11375 [Bdellovibrio bacteriovorus]